MNSINKLTESINQKYLSESGARLAVGDSVTVISNSNFSKDREIDAEVIGKDGDKYELELSRESLLELTDRVVINHYYYTVVAVTAWNGNAEFITVETLG